TTLDVRGEESRRGTVAKEMIRTGDFIVPRFHGEPHFMSARPPLQMWTIAATSLLTGEVDLFAVRFPSVVAIAFLAVVIYCYSRTFLTRMGAFCAAAAYLSMLQVLELGRTGETDAVFTLFVTCSLLSWHAGKMREWNPAMVWSLGYGFAALATLTKGPQGPVYFAGPAFIYLLVTRDWRYAFRPGHLVGILTFLCLWGPWQLLFFLSEGLEGVRHIYFGDVAMYGKEGSLLRHMIEYPLHLAVSFFPWSLFLLPLFRRELREKLGNARLYALFLVCCLAVTFPTVWLVKGARTRFFMPLFPCVAILAGIVIQRCYEAAASSPLNKDWRRSHLMFAIALPLIGLTFFVLSVTGNEWTLAQQPIGFAVIFFLMTILGSGVLWWARRDQRPRIQQAAVLSIAVFFGLIVNGIRLNALLATDVPRKEQVAAIEARVPQNETIYTLGGDVVHPFSF
ncbi:MAG: glycosyltransferase family 39 protein, partial [Planctomycetaceae bacterium]|nr:glycosyltransferase family 39 protein [Planctomycetaceae bacterium]